MKILNAFLAGLAVGLLCAPQSGKDTREKLAEIFNDSKESAKDFVGSAVDTVESKVHSLKEKIKDV